MVVTPIKTAGKLLQWGITFLFSKTADRVREKAGDIIGKMINKEKRPANYSPVLLIYHH
jgi:hypothetical protein